MPYLVAAFVFAVPLLVLELAVGRAFRLDVVAAFRSARREFAVLGWVVTGSVLLILSYYLVLTGWVLACLVGRHLARRLPPRVGRRRRWRRQETE